MTQTKVFLTVSIFYKSCCLAIFSVTFLLGANSKQYRRSVLEISRRRSDIALLNCKAELKTDDTQKKTADKKIGFGTKS